MSKKNPHKIMGTPVYGTADQGYWLEIKHYDSIENGVYIPDAQLMLNELHGDIDRLCRVINSRTHKLEKKLSESSD